MNPYDTLASSLRSLVLARHDIDDCIVKRTERIDRTEYSVFYVSRFLVVQSELDRLAAATVDPSIRLTFTQISSLPTGSASHVDAILSHIPHVDSVTAKEWESVLHGITGQICSVALEEVTEKPRTGKITYRDNASHTLVHEAADNVSVSHRPAITEAEPKNDADGYMMPSSIGDLIRKSVASFPRQTCVFTQQDGTRSTQTYAELYATALRTVGLVRSKEVHAGDTVIILNDDIENFVVAIWACFLGGYVALPLPALGTTDDAEAATRRFISIRSSLDRVAVLGSRVACCRVQQVADVGESETVLIHQEDADSSRSVDPYDSGEDPVALMLTTSGSTGTPKIVTLRHSAIIAEVCGCILRFGTSERDVFFHWMPMEHGASIAMMHVQALYSGAKQVLVPTQRILADPLLWLDEMSQLKASVTWAPQFAYSMLLDRLEQPVQRKIRSWDLQCMRLMFNGGEAIVPRSMTRVLARLQDFGLPPDAMCPAWGMSETASGIIFMPFQVTDYAESDVFACVGRPIAGTRCRIVDDNDIVVSESKPGHLQVKGPTVTSGYLYNAIANGESFTLDGWFRTGDLGFITGGSLTITGRSKDTIIVNGNNFYSHDLESIVEELPFIEPSFTAACAIRPPGAASDRLAIFCSIRGDTPTDLARDGIRNHLYVNARVSPTWIEFVAPSDVPKTDLGKIRRAELAARYKGALIPTQPGIGSSISTFPAWHYTEKWRAGSFLSPPAMPESVLILEGGESCVASSLARSLASAGVAVRTERVAPNELSDYRSCFASIFADVRAKMPTLVVYYDVSDGRDELTGSDTYGRYLDRCAWISAFARGFSEALPRIRLVVALSRSEAVTAGDRIQMDRVAFRDLLRVASIEHPGFSFSCIDVERDDESGAQHVLAELTHFSAERRVAWRDQVRYLPRLIPTWSSQYAGEFPHPFRDGGTYILTGGLGGIGSTLSLYLTSTYQARIAVIGRRSFAEIEADERSVDVLTELSRRVGFTYVSADVANGAELTGALDELEKQGFGSVDAIFHMAGHFETEELTELTRDDFDQSARAKVLGALHLTAWARLRGSPVILFSSAMAYSGAARCGAYCSANGAMDAIARTEMEHGGICKSYGFGIWSEKGMAARLGTTASRLLLDYPPMVWAQALASLQAAMTCPDPWMLIGVNARGPELRRHVGFDTQPVIECVACVTDKALHERLAQIMDRVCILGSSKIPVPCSIRYVSRHATASDPAFSHALAAISNIWHRILMTETADHNTDFFTAGGDSIRWTQLHHALEEHFHVSINWSDALACRTMTRQASLVLNAVAGLPADPQDGHQDFGYQGNRVSFRIIGTLGVGSTPKLIVPAAFQGMYGVPHFENLLSHDGAVVVVELPGFEDSLAAAPDAGPLFLMACLGALLDHLNLSKVDLIGVSMGCIPSYMLACERPDAIHRLVLIGFGAEISDETMREFERGRHWLDEGDTFAYAGHLVALASCNDPMVYIHNRDEVRNICLQRLQRLGLDAFWAFREPRRSLQPRLYSDGKAFPGPTLVITGEHDALSPIDAVHICASSLPNAILATVKGSDHLVIMQRTEQLAEALIAFLDDRNLDGLPCLNEIESIRR